MCVCVGVCTPLTSEGTLAGLRVLPDEGEELVLGLLEADLAVLHRLSQTRLRTHRHDVNKTRRIVDQKLYSANKKPEIGLR